MSSISGFSTNSHLEEGGDEGATGGSVGGKEDRISRNDPFAGTNSVSSTTNSQTHDPFAAFSVPGTDHFSLTGTLHVYTM